MVNSGGAYFQNTENSHKIEEITYNNNYNQQYDREQKNSLTANKKIWGFGAL